jgi:transposase
MTNSTELTKKQFDLIASIIRSREQPRRAASMILVDGLSNKDAAAVTGLSSQSIWNTLNRFRRTHKAILEAYRPGRRASKSTTPACKG